MNFMDLALIVILALGGLMGMWVGFIRAAFAVGGVVLGLVIFGQLKDYAVAVLANYVPSDTLTAALGYAVTISVLVAVAVIGAAIVRTIVYKLFLGWVDRFAGLALGLVAAGLISVTVVAGMAGFGHATGVDRDGLANAILEKTPHGLEIEEKLLDSFRDSGLVRLLVEVTDVLPDEALEKLPGELRVALDSLVQRVDDLGEGSVQ